jgi:hypothetical protein
MSTEVNICVQMDRIGCEKFDKNTRTESALNKPGRRRQRSQILGSSNQSSGNRNSGGQSMSRCLLFASSSASSSPKARVSAGCRLAAGEDLGIDLGVPLSFVDGKGVRNEP